MPRICRYTRRSRIIAAVETAAISVAVILLVTVAAVLIISFAQVTPLRPLLFAFPIAMLLGAFLLTRYAVKNLMFARRKYQISEDGISVYTAFRDPVFSKWEDIYEVSIIAAHSTAGMTAYESAICVLFAEPGPVFLKKITFGYWYPLKNMNKFVIIDYSDGVIDEFKAVCRRTVEDHRKEQLRKFSMG